MPKLKFFDVSVKKSFTTDNFKTEIRTSKTGRKTRIAIAVSPFSGNQSFRIISMNFKA